MRVNVENSKAGHESFLVFKDKISVKLSMVIIQKKINKEKI